MKALITLEIKVERNEIGTLTLIGQSVESLEVFFLVQAKTEFVFGKLKTFQVGLAAISDSTVHWLGETTFHLKVRVYEPIRNQRDFTAFWANVIASKVQNAEDIALKAAGLR